MITKEKALAAVIAVTIVNGFFSTNFIEKYKSMYSSKINKLESENVLLKNELSKIYRYGVNVDVTMYQANTIQCDDTPNITADGTRIKTWRATEYRYVALSRDLLSRWGGPFNYGDYIVIEGAGDRDGVYQVRDTMNPKWTNRVDILTTNDRFKYDDVVMYKYVDELIVVNQ